MKNWRTTLPAAGSRQILTLARKIFYDAGLTCRRTTVWRKVRAGLKTVSLPSLHCKLGTRKPSILPVRRPGAGMEETCPASIYTTTMTVWSMWWAPRSTLAAFERIRKAKSVTTISDNRIGLITGAWMTRWQEGTIKNSFRDIFLKTVMGGLPMRAENIVVTQIWKISNNYSIMLTS